MVNEQRLYFSLGLAQKAGKAVSGEYAVKSALQAGKLKLLVLATDSGKNSLKDFTNMAENHNVPYIMALDRQRLGIAVGKAPRAAVGITDKNFAEMLLK